MNAEENLTPLALYFKDHLISNLSKAGISWYKMTPTNQMVDSTLSIFISGNDMVITGSFGDAIYTFDDQVKLCDLDSLSLADFSSKCTSSPVGKFFLVWSPEAARKKFISTLQDYFRQNGQALCLESFLKQHGLYTSKFQVFFKSKIKLLASFDYYLPKLSKQINLQGKVDNWLVPDNRCYMQYLAIQSLARHLSNN
ncbi:hypothetical protein [Microscilla marina]|nr:hypothetical protein [Microscilla marina]